MRREKLLRFIETIQLLRGYLSRVEKIGLAASVDNNTIIGKHVANLAVLATTDRCPIGEISASAVVAARRSAALDYIASHFSDPRLSLAKVAWSLRISLRTYHGYWSSRDVIRFARH